MEDMMLEANEIQEVMSRSYGINDDIDEAELEAEFDALGNFPTVGFIGFLKLLKREIDLWINNLKNTISDTFSRSYSDV